MAANLPIYKGKTFGINATRSFLETTLLSEMINSGSLATVTLNNM
jgi:hypothetical protein